VLIEFDNAKRDKTLLERGLDFAQCKAVFAGPELTQLDSRSDYGEDRYITFGLLDACWVVVVWTPRGANRRIISMRFANEREIKRYARSLD
jgi:uncharacterized protein